MIVDCHGNGVTSAYFKHDEKIEDFMNLLILSQMKFENISEFSLIILVGVSECWDAWFSFNRLISVSMDWPPENWKVPLLLQLALIARMLGCFLYSRIVFKIGSLTFSIIGPKSEYWKMLRFFTRLPKNY